MSTLKTTNITHGSNSGTANVVLDAAGNTTLNGNLTVTGTVPSSITYATAVTANSTTHEFTGIPSSATKITVLWSAVTNNGSDDIQVQLGHSGGYYTSGYQSVGTHQIAAATSESGSTSAFLLLANDSACVIHAVMDIYKLNDSATSAEWVETHGGSDRNEYAKGGGGGLTGVTHTIDRVKISHTGSNTFDGGKINVMWN